MSLVARGCTHLDLEWIDTPCDSGRCGIFKPGARRLTNSEGHWISYSRRRIDSCCNCRFGRLGNVAIDAGWRKQSRAQRKSLVAAHAHPAHFVRL